MILFRNQSEAHLFITFMLITHLKKVKAIKEKNRQIHFLKENILEFGKMVVLRSV